MKKLRSGEVYLYKDPNPPVVISEGMTLRDYFAAKAMQVILKDYYEDGIYVGDSTNVAKDTCATSAYIMADAMLKARDK